MNRISGGNTSNSKDSKSEIIIFLDIDGVIADFDAHLETHDKRDATGKIKWDDLDHEWWASLPIFKGAKGFYYALRHKAPVKFLTAPIMNKDCFSGKAQWIQAFLPERGKRILMDLIICPSSDKKLLARKNYILVDDRIKNIEQWQLAGGIGILHEGDFEKTLQAVNSVCNKIQKQYERKQRSDTAKVFRP